jgi:hypothetical protein
MRILLLLCLLLGMAACTTTGSSSQSDSINVDSGGLQNVTVGGSTRVRVNRYKR